jgi:hypothetical protein
LGEKHPETLFAEVKLVELLVTGLQQFAEAEPSRSSRMADAS